MRCEERNEGVRVCQRKEFSETFHFLLHSVQILIKAADRQKEGINVTEAGERVYRALLRVSERELL